MGKDVVAGRKKFSSGVADLVSVRSTQRGKRRLAPGAFRPA